MPFNHHLHPKTRDQIAQKIIIPIIGPTSVGKTELMRLLVNTDDTFYRSMGFTTRPKHLGEAEDTYRFLPNSAEQQQEIIQQMTTGELLQFAIHPETGYLYGTNIDDYQGTYNVISTFGSEVSNFRSLGFASCVPIMLVASPNDWHERFVARKFTEDEARKRVKEGISSIEWGLQQDGAVRWVENKKNQLAQAVSEVIAIAKNQPYEYDQNAELVAKQLLHHLHSIARQS